jgi:RNA polymerase sigma-70 factor (ECF subfamily)
MGGSHDEALAAFMRVRPRLFNIAYRMLGDAAGAEDVVQDTWVRWQTANRSGVRDAAAFLVTTTTRLAINVLQSARSRRETSVGAFLTEPVDTSADPRLEAEQRQALASGVLVLLEKLTPTERVAYILREAFDYSYRQIASALRIEEANARQVVTRARQRVANRRRTSAARSDEAVDTFVQWIQAGSSAVIRGMGADARTLAPEVLR